MNAHEYPQMLVLKLELFHFNDFVWFSWTERPATSINYAARQLEAHASDSDDDDSDGTT
jgi:hypothetical protein